jgi:hypothetical protein
MLTKGMMFVAGLAFGFLSVSASPALAQRRGDVSFPLAIESKIGEETVKLARTGTALRKRGIFKIYAVASYLDASCKIRSAEELANADQAKQLHLVFLRGVSGNDMAQTFRSIFRQNYPEPQFKDEVKTLTDLFQRTAAQRGDEVWITHVPKVGLHCQRRDKEDVLIKNVDFAKAVWNNYLGKYNTGEDVKYGLISER